LPPKHQRGKQEFQILCNCNEKEEGRKNDISYRRAHRQPSTRKHLPEQRRIEAKKRKKKAPAQMDQQNTPHRASLILQTRSQDLDPGKAQRGNLSRKQNRKSKKQRARKTKEQELRRELDQNSPTAEEADKSQKKNTPQQGP
jgi:hypothetical protein